MNQMEWPKNSMAMKEDEVDPEVLKTVNQYYKAAVKNFLEDKKHMKYAISGPFLHQKQQGRKHPRSKSKNRRIR